MCGLLLLIFLDNRSIYRILEPIHHTANLSRRSRDKSAIEGCAITFDVFLFETRTGGSLVKNWPPNKLDRA